MSEGRKTPLEAKRATLFEPLYLSEVLGYDFHFCAHGQELIDSVGPRILENPEKLLEPVKFSDLSSVKSRLTLWSRGHFKTSAVVLYIVNLILAYPNIRILIMQSTAKNARGLLAEIKSHFDGKNGRSRLSKNFPQFCHDRRLGTADAFTTPARTRTYKEATVTIAGGRTSKAGQHYDFIFADDLVTEQNYRNQELQEKLIVDFNHYSSLLSGTAGYKSVTGTRYSFGDLYGHIIRKDAERREWAISIKNCWKDQESPKGGVLFPEVEAEPGRNIGFTIDQLLAMQTDDPETFSCQYLNQPLIASQQIFNELMLMSAVKPVDTRGEFTPTIFFCDLAKSATLRADKNVLVAGCTDGSGRMYVRDIRSGLYSPLQFAHVILEAALLHRPQRILIEGTAAGHYFIEYLRVIANSKGMLLNISDIKVKNHKDAKRLRISALEAPLKSGRLFFLAGLPGWTDLVQQFCEFPRGAHDDEIDTISLMAQHYQYQQQGFRALNPPSLPFFLRTAGVDYATERPIDPIGPTPVDSYGTCGADYDY